MTSLYLVMGYQFSIWPFLPENCMKMKSGEMFSKKKQHRIQQPGGRGEGKKHEIYVTTFGGHLFYDLFVQGWGGMTLDPLLKNPRCMPRGFPTTVNLLSVPPPRPRAIPRLLYEHPSTCCNKPIPIFLME